jgi:hypothetical protein
MCIEDPHLLAQTTNFQVFMTVMMDKSTQDKKEHVLAVLNILFPKYKVILTPRTLLFKNDALNIIIDENNFESL